MLPSPGCLFRLASTTCALSRLYVSPILITSLRRSICMAPTQAPFDFASVSPDTLKQTVQSIIDAHKAAQDKVAALSDEQCTFDAVVRQLSMTEAEFSCHAEPLLFLKNVSASEEMRNASVAATELVDVSAFAVVLACLADQRVCRRMRLMLRLVWTSSRHCKQQSATRSESH